MTLRKQIFRGGAYLTLRHGFGTVINIAGVLLLTRTIGTVQYGVFAAALGLFTVLHLLGRGVGVFLVRHEGENSAALESQAFTMLVLLGTGAAIFGAATLPLAQSWSRLPGLGRFTLALYAALPLTAVAQVPLARLERSLEYRVLAIVELSAQASLFVVAVGLGSLGYGAWSAVAGWWTYQLIVSVLYFRLAAYRPRWRWEPQLVRQIVAYGSGYTAAIWTSALRRLVNPLIVGRYLGPNAVAIVAVTTQVVTQLGFVAAAAWRLYPAALGRLQSDSSRLLRAISEGMSLQILAVAPFLLLFAWISPPLVPFALGSAWTPIVLVFPFIAATHLVISAFNVEASALHVQHYNVEVMAYNAVHVGVLGAASMFFLPRMGLLGYGLAELASIGAVIVVHLFTKRRIGPPDYGGAAPLLAAFGVALFWNQLRWWSLVALLAAVVVTKPWRQLMHAMRALRGISAEP